MRTWTALAAIGLLAACGSKGGTAGGGTGGKGNGSGSGGSSASGGSNGNGTGGNGSGGTNAGSGGQSNGTGGSSSGSGGQPSGSGGSSSGTGGGTSSGTGGNVSGSGGGAGGSSPGTGGGSPGTGGAGTAGSGQGGAAAMGGSAPGGMGGTVVACMAPLPVTGTAATVAVNTGATPLATVGPDLMGVHTAVYDGSMQLATTPDLLKAAGVTSLRYPGGSYADAYHWESHTATFVPTSNSGNNTIYVAPDADFGHFVSLLKNAGANAMITINYGMNSTATGPGSPQEAAAWVAYANGSPTSTTSIGKDTTDATIDWQTVGYWAGLRAAAPLPVDDGKNFLRISHPDPVGIRNWEIGNELYGNGYYYGSCGWEPDMHLPYPSLAPLTTCSNRTKAAALSPTAYGTAVKAFATAMKAVDPTVKVGAIAHWPYNEYADWNGAVLPQACTSIDFIVNHWYAGSSLTNLLSVAHTDIPMMYKDLRTALTTAANGCGAKGATMPIAVTEWGPNTGPADINAALAPPAGTPYTHTQIPGLFAAEAYANFMEQGALAVHWLELHNGSYLGGDDTQAWGYHGALIAHYLAGVGDALIPATATGAAAANLYPHASKHADGSVSVMLTNTSATVTAAVTINVTGTTLGCVGARYSYAPVMTDMDAPVTGDNIFAAANGGSVAVSVPPYSVVTVVFPKK